jgi:hypothetical protein
MNIIQLCIECFEEFWEDMDSLFDEKNRQIIIRSHKVTPLWFVFGRDDDYCGS